MAFDAHRSAVFEADGAPRTDPPAAAKTITTQKADRVMPDGMKPVPSEGLSADKLIGATVFGADETKIGTVGDVLMTADGQTEAFVVDVGKGTAHQANNFREAGTADEVLVAFLDRFAGR